MKGGKASKRALPAALLLMLAVQAAAVLAGSCPRPPVMEGPRPRTADNASPAECIFWGLPLDIDLARADDLERIPGIGEKRARRIARWRREHGPIEDPGELKAIPGIGEKTVELLRGAMQ